MEANTKSKLEKMLRSAVSGILANPDSQEAITALRQFAKGVAKEIEPTNISFYDSGKSEFQTGAAAVRDKMRMEEALRSINENATDLNAMINAIRNGEKVAVTAPTQNVKSRMMEMLEAAGATGLTFEQMVQQWPDARTQMSKRRSELVSTNKAFKVGDRFVLVKHRDAYPTEYQQHKTALGV